MIRYQVRLLRDIYVEDSDEVSAHAGEVLILDPHETIAALRQGWGEYVGEILDGIRCVPVQDPRS